MQAPRPTPSSGRDTPWSSTAHGKTPALPRCPTPQPPRSTLGSCAPRHSGDPWGTPGALEHPAAIGGACAAAWARVGPRLCWAGRGAACWCYTAGAASGCPAPPLCPARSPPPWGAHSGCCWGVREPKGTAALGEGWAGLAAVVSCATCGGGQHRACQLPRRVRDGGAGLGSGHRRSFSRKQSPGVRGMMFRPQGAQGVQDRFNE